MVVCWAGVWEGAAVEGVVEGGLSREEDGWSGCCCWEWKVWEQSLT